MEEKNVKPAVVVWNVDTQRDFMETSGKLYVPGSEAIIHNINMLLHDAFQKGSEGFKVKVFGSADEHTFKTPGFPDSVEFKDWPVHCVAGTPGQKHMPGTAHMTNVGVISWMKDYTPGEFSALSAKRQVILTKDSTDILNPAFEKQVWNFHRLMKTVPPGSTFIVTGIVTEICVKHEVDALADWVANNGGRVILVTDAVKEFDQDKMRVAMAEMRARKVMFANTNEALSVIKWVSKNEQAATVKNR